MSKLKYEIMLPKNPEQLEGQLKDIFRKNTNHIMVKILDEYIAPEDLNKILHKLQASIKKFRKNKSLIILTDNYEAVPDFVPVSPTEEEGIDIIEFEEIERDLMLDE